MDPRTFQKINLAVCLTGIAAYIFVCIFYSVRIYKKKKSLSAAGKTAVSAQRKFFATLVMCACVVLLPVFIWFRQFYVTAVIEGSGVLGALLAFRDRLEELEKQLSA
jgi:hypothetical protein